MSGLGKPYNNLVSNVFKPDQIAILVNKGCAEATHKCLDAILPLNGSNIITLNVQTVVPRKLSNVRQVSIQFVVLKRRINNYM